MIATDRSTLVDGRLVFTYWPDAAPWYTGLLTGHDDGRGGIVLEHVVALKPGAVLPTVRAGIAAVAEAGYRYVTFAIPDDYPVAKGLQAAAKRVGATCHAHERGWTHWVLAL
jgi:hypothetical protein